MLFHYFIIALRNLVRHKTFAMINIGGLAVSLASCLFIFYYVYDELTYDRSHAKADRIYRITQTFITPENIQNLRFTNQKIALYLKRVYPQVENYVRLEDTEVRLGKSKIKEKGVVRADPTVFDVFTYPLIQGSAETALQQPNSIVLSETLARKYFDGDAMGASLDVDGEAFIVTGIMADVPANSDKWISALVHGNFEGEETQALSFLYDTYILLHNQSDADFIRKSLSAAADGLHVQAGQPISMGYDMQALPDLHFFHGTEMDNPKGNKTNVYIFAIVAIVLLVVSIFNFINLTTMRSLDRAKEVGIRKTAGAKRSELVRQFLSESFLSVVAAAVGALIIINVLKIIFELISGKTISLSNPHDLAIIGVTLALLAGIILFSSFYPAWVLSSYQPIKVLRGKPTRASFGGMIRKIFTTGQFALSTGLLLFLVTILFQMDFMTSADLGFVKDEILVLKAPEDSLVKTNLSYFKNEFRKSKSVSQVSIGGFASNLGTNEPFASPVFIRTGTEDRQLIVPNIVVDKTYPEMLQLKVRQGKSFADIEGENAGGNALVNESFVKLAGWTDPIGQKVKTYGGEATVIGVIDDFHFQSLHKRIEPIALLGMNEQNPDARYFFLKTNPASVNDIRVLWRRLFPNHEMDSFFLDEFFDAQYKADKNLRLLFIYFTILTIMVTTAGLLALTIHHIELKMRETSIRKIFGAGILSLIQLQSKEFSKLIATGLLLGTIAGFFIAGKWLTSFAYHVQLDLLIILLPLICITLYR